MAKAKKTDVLGRLRAAAEGVPIDVAAADRYVDALPDLDDVLRLVGSKDPVTRQTGVLRAAAVVAAVDRG